MRTTNFGLRFAAKHCKQKTTVAADLWGGANTPTLGAGDQVLFEELNIEDSPDFWEDASRNGTQLATGQEISMVKADVNGKFPLYVEGSSHILASILGWEDLEGPIVAGSNFSHLIYFNPLGKDQRDFSTAEQGKITGWASGDKYNTHLTFGRVEGPVEKIARNVQISEFTISGAQKEPLRVEFSGFGENVVRDTAKTTSGAWSLPVGSFDQVYHIRHCTTSKIGPVGAQLDCKLLDFSIKGKFGMASDNQSTLSGINREYPYSDGMSELTFETTIFLHDTETYKDWEANQTTIAVKLAFTRGTKTMTLYIPALKVQTAKAEIDNASSVKITGKIFNYTGVDQFLTDHPTQAQDFASPLLIQMVDSSNVNGLRRN